MSVRIRGRTFLLVKSFAKFAVATANKSNPYFVGACT